LPPSEKGIMRKEIEDVVFNPKNAKGYVTDPIKIDGGFLILRIDDRTEAGQASFDEAREQIQEFLARPKITPKLREYLSKLRQQAFLEIKDGYVDSGAVPGKDTRWHEVVGLKPETTTKEEVAAHRKRKKFLGVIPHGSVAPGTKETSAAKGTTPPDTTPPATPPIKQ
jgi:peptidyl-prolyl cis-trans isomerase SurA